MENIQLIVDRHKGQGWTRIAVTALYIVAALTYLTWRTTAFNPDAPVFSSLFYAAEVYGFLMSLLIIWMSWRLKERSVVEAERGLSVDVFVTVYNEPIDIVRRTLLGATHIEYPHQTWLLDDGNRSEMRALADELGCRYLAREHNIGAKAGNLNNGLKHSKADFIAIFDADHVAQKNFLHKLLGYFRDPKVCFVQTPQDYFNLDSFQHGRHRKRRLIWHEQSFFHYVGQPGRDHWNAATLCGCSAIIRRDMLDEIGGFPTETVTEDMHAAVRLHKLGYTSVFHAEPLAFGVAPADFRGFVRQRLRWGEGNMQVCREEGLPFTRDLTVPQRFLYFALTSTYLDGWQKLVYYSAPIIVLFTQVPPIWMEPFVFAAYFVPYFFFSWIYFEESGRGYGRILATEKFSMARFGVALIATLGLVRKNIKFRISSKELTGRLPVILLMPQVLILVLGAVALGLTAARPILGLDLLMPAGITIFIGAWTLLNCVTAFSVIRDAVRSAASDDQEYLFPIKLPLGIDDWDHGRANVVLDSISVTRFSFTTRRAAAVDPGTILAGQLYLPGGPIPYQATVADVHREASTAKAAEVSIDCVFIWPDSSDRDRLDRCLHAGRWHRVMLSQKEYVRTPIEWLKHQFGAPRQIVREDQEWVTVLYRPVGSPEAALSFGLISDDRAAERPPILIAFEKLPEGASLAVIVPGKEEEKQYIYRVTGVEKAVERDSGLDLVNATSYRILKSRLVDHSLTR